MKRSTLLSIFICALLIILVPAAVWAIKSGKAPKAQSGSFSRNIIDRIDFSIENNEFRLKKDGASPEDYTISFYLSAKKTQADFYGRIDNVTIEGMSYDNIVFIPQNENCNGLTLTDMLLPVVGGEPAEVKWRADLTFSSANTKPLSPVIKITYTSGISLETSDTHILEIPLSVTFE